MTPVEKAIKKRDEYLKRHPHLSDYQKEIDETLTKTPDEYRMQTMEILMKSKLIEMQTQLLFLQNILTATKQE